MPKNHKSDVPVISRWEQQERKDIIQEEGRTWEETEEEEELLKDKADGGG
jgi:hypothetical protein